MPFDDDTPPVELALDEHGEGNVTIERGDRYSEFNNIADLHALADVFRFVS